MRSQTYLRKSPVDSKGKGEAPAPVPGQDDTGDKRHQDMANPEKVEKFGVNDKDAFFFGPFGVLDGLSDGANATVTVDLISRKKQLEEADQS